MKFPERALETILPAMSLWLVNFWQR